MAAISSGGARPAVSSITETRYCISDHLLWFGAPLVGGLSPLLRTPPPRSDTASRIFFRGLSGTPVVSDPTARRFRGDCAGFLGFGNHVERDARSSTALGHAAKVTDGADLSRTPIRRLGKRVGGNPSGVRISHPPPDGFPLGPPAGRRRSAPGVLRSQRHDRLETRTEQSP